eukprot:Skav219951  [mRNA]  locus=scaffold2879:154558:158548:+ [translate_table: standard]
MLRLLLLLRLVAALRDLVVPTSNGPVRGVFRDFAHQSASWWGIRYAEPPLGANRFKEPKVYKETWTTPRWASQIPSPCMQLSGKLGCPSSSSQLECLRRLPASAVVEVEAGLDGHRPKVRSPLWPLMPNGPAIDGTESGLLDVPMKLVREGRFNRVPLLLGSNENGGSIFEAMLPLVMPGAQLPVKRHPETFDKAMRLFFQENVSKVEAVYNQKEFPDNDVLIRRVIRDLMFMCPLRALASAWSSAGLPTFLYVFDFSYGLAALIGLGDFHGSELPFVFRNWLEFIKPIDPFQSPRRMSNIISCKWTSFANGHDPNGGTNESQWVPGCEDINGRYSEWPKFGRERLFYTLKARPDAWMCKTGS